jgi:PAS domain S-box-containing protein
MMKPITDFELRIGEKMNATKTKKRVQACEEEQRVNRIPEIQNPESEIIKVLLIEDNPGDARLLREMLIEAGINKFNLVHVKRISEGLNRLRQDNFQVILLDLSLPDSHGLETVDRVCNAAPYVPVLVLTGLDDEALAIRAVRKGAQDYLIKGQMDGNLLVRAIRYATERKRTEEALKESEDIFNSFMEHSPIYVFFKDENARPIRLSRNYEQMLGRPVHELLGKTMDELFPSELAKGMVEDDLRILRDGKPFEVVEELNGRIFETTKFPIVKQGKPSLLAGFTIDITERKHAAEEMANLQEQLRQSQKMEAIGCLAGGIAHDFNNLLTVIKGYGQLSLLGLKEDSPLRGNIEEINRATDRSADLIRQLLIFSRRQVMEMRVLDLNILLQNLDKMLRRVIGEDIELVTLLAEDPGRVKTDPGQIEQVILNLAVNARDAMPSGGKLTIETANVELDETYARRHVAVTPGRYVMLAVSDTGVGMTPEVRDRVFEPFFTTKEKGKGTGLGLSTVYGIVKQSEGNIWIYSEPGHGTIFKIYLPQAEGLLEEVKEKVVGEELPRGSETVLVVEDEQEVRKLAVRILRGQGYKVLEASNGTDTLTICKEQKDPFHLILTDVVMPQMSGCQLVEQLRRVYQNFKVLYMSGYTDNTIVHHGVLERGINYIQKPFTVGALADKVREVLDNKDVSVKSPFAKGDSGGFDQG